MLKIERFARIEEELKKKGSLEIPSLSQMLGCSEETVRRDLRELESDCSKALHKISELPGYWRNYPRKEIFERVVNWHNPEFKYIMANYNGYVSWKDFTKNWSVNKWIEMLGY